MAGKPPNWVDRTRPLWRVGNRMEAFQLRWLGLSPMALLNRGRVLVIETTGRRTGRRRFTPVGYWQDGEGAFFVGGGAAGQTRLPTGLPTSGPRPRPLSGFAEDGFLCWPMS
jgi:hypothetical protein